MSVPALNELHVYTCTGLMQPECMKEHLLGMTTNSIGHSRCVGFNFEKVGIPYDDVGLDFWYSV